MVCEGRDMKFEFERSCDRDRYSFLPAFYVQSNYLPRAAACSPGRAVAAFPGERALFRKSTTQSYIWFNTF
eukprot:scaffold23026_cov47-Attheya_sp.AAC.2